MGGIPTAATLRCPALRSLRYWLHRAEPDLRDAARPRRRRACPESGLGLVAAVPVAVAAATAVAGLAHAHSDVLGDVVVALADLGAVVADAGGVVATSAQVLPGVPVAADVGADPLLDLAVHRVAVGGVVGDVEPVTVRVERRRAPALADGHVEPARGGGTFHSGDHDRARRQGQTDLRQSLELHKEFPLVPVFD
ncbi:hypothetical protein ACFYRC_09395 [Streptomyces sp. NPDC005279]|uniref:effector-associated constant component EACC1 n=1 Tax=Streptomyces sp. NPDC005279 TaxID=3364712 RepID=UPI0036973D9F